MDHLETLGRSAAAEVLALDERDAESSQRRFARGGRAESTAADDQDVEFAFG